MAATRPPSANAMPARQQPPPSQRHTSNPQLVALVRGYVNASCMVERSGLASPSVHQWAAQASSGLSDALSHLDFELPSLVPTASMEATPPLTDSAGKPRALSKHQKRQAKIGRRRKIIQKIRPKIEQSQSMRKTLDDAIQTATGVTWGKGANEPQYRDTESNRALSGDEYGRRYFERYLHQRRYPQRPDDAGDEENVAAGETLRGDASSSLWEADHDQTRGENGGSSGGGDVVADQIAAAEARCWQAIEAAMQRLEEERAAIRSQQQGRADDEHQQTQTPQVTSGLKVSPIRASLEKNRIISSPKSRGVGQVKKKKKTTTMKMRKETRRSIDMKVPDLFDDDDDGLFGKM